MDMLLNIVVSSDVFVLIDAYRQTFNLRRAALHIRGLMVYQYQYKCVNCVCNWNWLCAYCVRTDACDIIENIVVVLTSVVIVRILSFLHVSAVYLPILWYINDHWVEIKQGNWILAKEIDKLRFCHHPLGSSGTIIYLLWLISCVVC